MYTNIYVIQSDNGYRVWQADSTDHAVEQHKDAFPDEAVLGVSIAVKSSSEYPGVTA